VSDPILNSKQFISTDSATWIQKGNQTQMGSSNMNPLQAILISRGAFFETFHRIIPGKEGEVSSAGIMKMDEVQKDSAFLELAEGQMLNTVLGTFPGSDTGNTPMKNKIVLNNVLDPLNNIELIGPVNSNYEQAREVIPDYSVKAVAVSAKNISLELTLREQKENKVDQGRLSDLNSGTALHEHIMDDVPIKSSTTADRMAEVWSVYDMSKADVTQPGLPTSNKVDLRAMDPPPPSAASLISPLTDRHEEIESTKSIGDQKDLNLSPSSVKITTVREKNEAMISEDSQNQKTSRNLLNNDLKILQMMQMSQAETKKQKTALEENSVKIANVSFRNADLESTIQSGIMKLSDLAGLQPISKEKQPRNDARISANDESQKTDAIIAPKEEIVKNLFDNRLNTTIRNSIELSELNTAKENAKLGGDTNPESPITDAEKAGTKTQNNDANQYVDRIKDGLREEYEGKIGRAMKETLSVGKGGSDALSAYQSHQNDKMYSSVMKTALSHVNESKILLDHIAENSLVLLKNDFARVRLTLNPPQLGILDMNMHMNKDRIKLVLTAETTEVKQILQTNLEQLKNTLQEQGINIDRLDVLVQDHGGKDEQSGRGAKAYQQQSTSEMHDDAVSTKESNNVYTHEIELNMFRGDETISVFA